jgi:hypothetical protein
MPRRGASTSRKQGSLLQGHEQVRQSTPRGPLDSHILLRTPPVGSLKTLQQPELAEAIQLLTDVVRPSRECPSDLCLGDLARAVPHKPS